MSSMKCDITRERGLTTTRLAAHQQWAIRRECGVDREDQVVSVDVRNVGSPVGQHGALAALEVIADARVKWQPGFVHDALLA